MTVVAGNVSPSEMEVLTRAQAWLVDNLTQVLAALPPGVERYVDAREVSRALAEMGDGIATKGFKLANVVALSPEGTPLEESERLFGYLVAAVQMKKLLPPGAQLLDIPALAARARALSPADQGLFRLTVALGIGIYKARLVKGALG